MNPFVAFSKFNPEVLKSMNCKRNNLSNFCCGFEFWGFSVRNFGWKMLEGFGRMQLLLQLSLTVTLQGMMLLWCDFPEKMATTQGDGFFCREIVKIERIIMTIIN